MFKKWAQRLGFSCLVITVSACGPLHTPRPLAIKITEYGPARHYALRPAPLAAVHPHWHSKLAPFELGAYYINDPAQNELHLLIALADRAEIEALGITIDETKYTFISKAPTRQTARLYPALHGLLAVTSVKKFDVPVELIEDMLQGRKVLLEVRAAAKTYTADFSYDCQRGGLYHHYGCQTFTEFYLRHLAPTLK